MTFCAPKEFHGRQLRLRAESSIQNEIGRLAFFSESPAFVVYASGNPSINFTKHPSAVVSAASVYDNALGFRYNYGTFLDTVCQQGRGGLFKYSIVLICSGQKLEFRCPLQLQDRFVESSQCLLAVPGISFIRPAENCFFNVSAGNDIMVSKSSQEFHIIPGVAKTATLVGLGPFCASAGAIVWSVNSTPASSTLSRIDLPPLP
jgi:hypothetical protein